MTAADDTIRAAVLDALSAAGVRDPDVSDHPSYVLWKHATVERYQLVVRFGMNGTLEFDPHWYESDERAGWDRLFAPVQFASITALVESVGNFLSDPCRDTAVAALNRKDR